MAERVTMDRKVWAVPVAGLALVLCGSVAAADGDKLFKSKCTTCHTDKKALDAARKVEADKRAAHFEKFLSTHFAPDPGERAAIVDYLIKATAN
jgi:cytochrome c5